MTYQDLLDQVSFAQIIVVGSITLTLLLYLISKLVYVERGVLPLTLKYVEKGFNAFFGEVKYFGGFLFGYTKEETDEFLANENLLKGMSNTITGVAVILVIFSFLASYSASRDFVISRGISPNIAFAIPLGIDGFIVLLILYISYQSLKGEGTIFGRVFLGIFTILSVYFNISHLEPDINLWTTAIGTAGAIAPSIVFIGMEVVSSVQKAQVMRSGLALTDQQLRGRIEENRGAVENIAAELEAGQGHIEEIEAEKQTAIDDAKAEMLLWQDRIDELKASLAILSEDREHLEEVIAKLDRQFGDMVPNGVDRLQQVGTLLEQGLNVPEIANELNIQHSTARSYIRQVNGKH